MSDATPKPQAPRIAIKFGAPATAGSKTSRHAANGHSRSQPSSTLGKRQRSNALHHDSDSGDDDDSLGRHVAVTTIGGDAAASTDSASLVSKRRTTEYVIDSQKNRDWKADARSKNVGRPKPPQRSSMENLDREIAPADQDTDTKWGLNTNKKPDQKHTSDSDDDSKEKLKDTSEGTVTPAPKDADKEAIDALLGKRNAAQLVIKDATLTTKSRLSEQDSYQRSMREAADVSTTEEYSEIPEGEFGAAMLRGMGWKGEEFGSKPKEVKRRPHLMGLGSKEDEEIKKAELAKRQGFRAPRPRLDNYRRDREKDKQERNERHRNSYKSERERERRERGHDHSHGDRYRERDHRGHR
ncbi:DExH-box splicing factor binding site-domain-containing protein [Nemania sp. FL0916]|nr:DExH-box splicing factor binding site-domain-containing protein [Nemania sp. FL0916]